MKKFVGLLLVMCVLSISAYGQEKEIEPRAEFIAKGDLILGTFYHKNGQIAQQGYFTRLGKLHGSWTMFDTEGNKITEAQYHEGYKVGKWLFYHEDTLREVVYNKSKIESVNTWSMVSSRVVSN